jgi:hypothetical protein
MVKKANGK